MKCHKSITITENTVKIAQRFASADELCKGHFGKLGQRWVLSLANNERFSPPFPLPLSFKALHHLCDIMR